MFGKSVSLEACGLCCLIIHSFLRQLRHLLGKHSNCGAGAYLLQNLWDPSSLAWDRTHIPALQGGLSTTGPKGESLPHVLLWRLKKIAHLTAQSGANSSNSINVWVSSFALFFFKKFTFDLFFKNHPSCPMETIYKWNEWKRGEFRRLLQLYKWEIIMTWTSRKGKKRVDLGVCFPGTVDRIYSGAWDERKIPFKNLYLVYFVLKKGNLTLRWCLD